MTGDICLLCTRNRTRRWLRHHVPEVSGGMTGTGLAAIIVTWPASGVAGWAGFMVGYVTVIAGAAGLIAWAAGWRPSFRWRVRMTRWWFRRHWPELVVAVNAAACVAAAVLIVMTEGHT
jgi:hypothetical protein